MRKREGNKETDILEAAVKVFATEGYHKAKISSIAELAGVATGSVYLYYDSKEEIILKIFNVLWMKLLNELKLTVKRNDLGPSEKLDYVVDLLFDAFTMNSSLAIVFVNEQNHLIQSKKGSVGKHFNEFLDIAEEIVREGTKRKIFNANIDIKLFRNFITGGLRTLLRLWAQQPEEYPLNRIRQNVKFFIKNGILLDHTKI
jgi:TetR/AcrR family transcriptional regulator, fatty acid metabolism regulator protein